MLRDAFEYLTKLAVDAVSFEEIEGGNRNKNRYFGPDNKVVEVRHDTPARQHTVSDLESFAARIESPDKASVWHHGNKVVAILDDSAESYRDDIVSWPIKGSSKFESLVKQAPTPRAHVDFVRFIVQNLRDEFDASAPGLLGTIRNLKMKSLDTYQGEVQHGRESMGRDIQNEIAGADKLPETIVIRVRRWADLDCFAEVECLLVLDVDARKLSLQPLADELEQAENAAQKWLHELLSGAVEASVFYGTP